MSFKRSIIKDYAGFTIGDIKPKTIRTQKVTTKRLCVTEDAEIQNLDVDSVNVSQLNLNGQFNSTSTSVFDFNGLIKINQANYVLTVTQLEQALADAAVTGGSSIVLAPGTFFISETLVVPANTDIIGSGPNTTIIKARDGFASSPSSMMYIAGGNNAIQNLQIDGNNGSSRLIDITNCSNVGLQNLELKKTSGSFIKIRNSVNNISCTNLYINNKTPSLNQTIDISSSTNISFLNILFDNIISTGLPADFTRIESAYGTCINISDYDIHQSVETNKTCNNISFNNVSFVNLSKTYSIVSVYSSTDGNNVTNCSFINFNFKNSTFQTVFRLSRQAALGGDETQKIKSVFINNVKFSDCTVGPLTTASTHGSLIYVEGVLDCELNSIVVTDITDVQQAMRFTGYSKNINISNCYFISNNDINDGISLQTTNTFNIENSYFQGYRYAINGVIENGLISNNIFSNCSLASIILTSSNKINIFNCTTELNPITNLAFINTSNVNVTSCKVESITDNIIDTGNPTNITYTDNFYSNCILDFFGTVSDITISNMNISGNGSGTLIDSPGSNLLINNSKLSNGENGIVNSSTSFIKNCTITNCNNAISLQDSNSIVSLNKLDNNTINITNSSGNNSMILNNFAIQSYDSNSTVSGYDSFVTSNASTDNIYLTLPDITENSAGQKIKFESVDTGNVYITPSSPGNDLINLASLSSNVLINVASEFVTFEWTGNKWNVISGSSGIVIT